MSIKLMTAVWAREDLSSTQKLVLLSLADWANDEGLCWPSIDRLAIKTSMAGRSVQRIIRDLESMGFVRRDEVLGKGNRYWISIPLTECHPCHSVTPPLTDSHPTPDTVSPNTSITHQSNTKYIRRELPECIPLDAWQGWVELRNQRKKPLTDRAYNKAVDKLVAFVAKGHDITEILDRSTMNGWLDLYELKETRNAGSISKSTTEPTNNMVRAVLASQARRAADGERSPDDWP
jgi:hypothetical protein